MQARNATTTAVVRGGPDPSAGYAAESGCAAVTTVDGVHQPGGIVAEAEVRAAVVPGAGASR